MSLFDEDFDIDLDAEEHLSWSSLGIMALMIPMATASIGLMIGLGLGGAAGYLAATGEHAEQKFVENISVDQVKFGEVCAPVIQEAETEIASMNRKIDTLETDIAERQTRVDALRSEMEKRAEGGRHLWNELKVAKEELALVKQERDMLVVAKDQLVEQLTITTQKLAMTEEKLEETIEVAEEYRYESIHQNFDRFVNEAQLQICERGNRKKLGKCREIVTNLLMRPDVHGKFNHCIKSGQATPNVAELVVEDGMPPFSAYLNQEDRVVRDWYVHLCDPTLPENPTVLAAASF
jgi:hypothetical protein